MVSLLGGSLVGPSPAVANANARLLANNSKNDDQDTAKAETGLRFRLSPGVDQPEARPASKLAITTELSQPETENILKRLPPMQADPNGAQEFALREQSLPPPRTGKTIDISFPTSASASLSQEVTSGPLEVVRYAPEGSVPLAPELSVTFSQPMIALTSQEEAATNVPVKLIPQPPGKWHWLGTKTLLFGNDGRFPMATTYIVTVPAGTRAANGSTLATEKSWRFTTPPPTVKASYPSKDSTQPRDALMFMEFDQRVAATRTIRLRLILAIRWPKTSTSPKSELNRR